MSDNGSTAFRSGELVEDGDALRSQRWRQWEAAWLIHAHTEAGDAHAARAAQKRTEAGGRGLLWERELKWALREERQAREHYTRAKYLRTKSASSSTVADQRRADGNLESQK